MYAPPVGGVVGEVGPDCTGVVGRFDSGSGSGLSIHVVASSPSRC